MDMKIIESAPIPSRCLVYDWSAIPVGGAALITLGPLDATIKSARSSASGYATRHGLIFRTRLEGAHALRVWNLGPRAGQAVAVAPRSLGRPVDPDRAAAREAREAETHRLRMERAERSKVRAADADRARAERQEHRLRYRAAYEPRYLAKARAAVAAGKRPDKPDVLLFPDGLPADLLAAIEEGGGFA